MSAPPSLTVVPDPDSSATPPSGCVLRIVKEKQFLLNQLKLRRPKQTKNETTSLPLPLPSPASDSRRPSRRPSQPSSGRQHGYTFLIKDLNLMSPHPSLFQPSARTMTIHDKRRRLAILSLPLYPLLSLLLLLGRILEFVRGANEGSQFWGQCHAYHLFTDSHSDSSRVSVQPQPQPHATTLASSCHGPRIRAACRKISSEREKKIEEKERDGRSRRNFLWNLLAMRMLASCFFFAHTHVHAHITLHPHPRFH